MKDISEIVESLQKYGAECEILHLRPSVIEAYRQGWIDGLEEFKRQLRSRQ